MELEKLGWDRFKLHLSEKENISEENIARVAVENRGGYLLYSTHGELEGIVQGKFIKEAKDESYFPKVGDWVVIEKLPQESKAVIRSILPRAAKISRKRAGEDVAEQIIATNIDIVFIVQGLDGDFNISRLERYVAMAKEGGCEPIILLNKSDIAIDPQEKMQQTKNAFPNVKIFLVSAKNGQGVEEIRALVDENATVVFVGSSGVGKSTLINALLGLDLQKTQEVRFDDSRGRHTTTKRELLLLPSGGLLIDTPGMRELGLWASQEALGDTFDDIGMFAQLCRFNDCDHIQSPGCAVLEALQNGKIDRQRYERFIKLSAGLDHFQAKKERNAAQAQKRSRRTSRLASTSGALRESRRVIKKPEFKKK